MSNAAVPATKEQDRSDSPLHVAVIMDGNGRWAAARGLARAEGHRRGVEALRRVVKAAHTRLNLIVAFNYGSRQEIANAAQRLAREVAEGKRDPASIDADTLGQYLDAPDIPDPDLIIRTSGEQRLSNFLMWQAAYSELVFVPMHWPDFDKAALESAIAEYSRRERRFGGLVAKAGS
jgi:undecaprenyl pyrophosphate synthase